MSGPVTPGSSARTLFYSALVPGLGHARLGRMGWAALFAVPLVVLLGALAGALVVLGPATLAAYLLDPAVLAALLVVQGGLFAWRAGAVVTTAALARPPLTTATVAWIAAAAAILVAPQAYAGYLTSVARDTALEIFAPSSGSSVWVPPAAPPPAVGANDDAFATPGATPSPSPDASPSPFPSPSPSADRVTVLLIGMDSGVGRETALTDTMIVASLDPVGETVSMVSVPRDMVDVPLPDGRIFRPKINSLVSHVRWHPSEFPGAPNGQAVLAAALGELLQVRVDAWAQVDMGGFIGLVDSVGGIDLTVRDGFCDPTYDEYGMRGFSITPGRYHFDGARALAYARIRKAAGENDFTRAARQQEVIAALRDRIVSGGLLADPARFLRSLGRTVRTSVEPALVAEHIDVATHVGRSDVFRAVIGHPLVRTGFDARGSIQIPDIPAIRKLAGNLFPPAGTTPTGFATMPAESKGATRQAPRTSSCRLAPKPKPSPSPSPSGSPATSAAPSASGEISPAPGGSVDPSATASTSPSPSPAPTPSPSPAPTPSPSPAPTPSPSPAPTPSPSPSPSGSVAAPGG